MSDVLTELRKLETFHLSELEKVRAALVALRGAPSKPLALAAKRRRRSIPRRGYVQELALDVLRESSNLTGKEIATRLGADTSYVLHALAVLCDKKRVIRSGIGTKNNPYRWALREESSRTVALVKS